MTILSHILAENGFPFDLLFFAIIFLLVPIIRGILEKMKESQRKQQHSQRRRRPEFPMDTEAETPAPRRPSTTMETRPAERTEPQARNSVEEIVQTMRQAQAQRQPEVAPAPIARPKPKPKPAARRAKAPKRTRRPRPEPTPEPVAAPLVPAAEDVAPVAAISPLQIDLTDLDEVRRGVIFSEILAPPVAMRRERGKWEM